MSTISFGNADAVTGPPTINGFIDHDFLNSGESGEPGYTNGFRRSFDGGTLSPVLLQGVRVTGGDQLVIGILARFDNSWDDNDQVVIALKPTPSSPQAQARMLVIRPVLGGIGVEPGVGVTANQIKTNVPLPSSRWDLWKGNASGAPWTQVEMGGLPAIEIRVRSWLPTRPSGAPSEKAWGLEISLPRLASGNPNWLDLNDGFGAYINVIRVNPELGAIQNTFPETSLLTGAIGATLAIPAYGTALIPALQTPPGSNPGLGIVFPSGFLSIGARPVGDSGAPGSNIRGSSSPDTRDNEILAIVRNSGPSVSGIQATFAFANWGLSPVTSPAWTQPATLTPNPTTASGPIATGAEQPLSTIWTRAQVSTAGFGPPNDHQCMTATLSASSAVNFVQVATRRNMDFVTLSSHVRDAEINTKGLPVPPGGAAAQDIILRSFVREIRLADLVMGKANSLSDEMIAVASGALSTGAREILNQFEFDVSPESLFDGRLPPESRRALAESLKNHVAILWLTEGLRRTGTKLTINGTTYQNLAAELGSFGYIAHHVGITDGFSWSITGNGLTRIAPGILRIRIKQGEVARVKVRIAMAPEERPGDISNVPLDPDWKSGEQPSKKDSWLCRLLRALFGFLPGSGRD